jgi:hypothetical protein
MQSGVRAPLVGNGLFEFLVPAAATGGALSVFRASMPEGFAPPRHVHTREDEVFLILGGALFRNLGVPAGTRTLPPPGTVPFDLPAVMAEQERLGTQVVGPPLTPTT